MHNSFVNALEKNLNYTRTENFGLAHRHTDSKVLELFGLGAAYRSRSDDDCILLFKSAYEEDPDLAMKCLFYIRNIRGGQGERRFFRVCFRWLCDHYPQSAIKNFDNVVRLGRWDDLIYSAEGTQVESEMLKFVGKQLIRDLNCSTPSLLGKWCPSITASSRETRRVARKIVNAFGVTEKQYRQALSLLRSRINIVEKLMSENKWDEISFDGIPSKAGLKYSHAFQTRDETRERYAEFINSKKTKVNAAALYPYEVVNKAIHVPGNDKTARNVVDKYWDNLPDYFDGTSSNMLCVVDTSGSMMGAPINVAISLGMYCAEHLNGPFHNKYISFASRPQLIDIEGVDFVDKVKRIYRTNLCDNTNLEAVFDLLLDTIVEKNIPKEDIPHTICVISDMEIDMATSEFGLYYWETMRKSWTKDSAVTEMEKIRNKWAAAGVELPKLVYWNVNARHNLFLDSGDAVSFVSGASPVLFKSVLTQKSGYELMMEVLNGADYADIKA